MKKSLLAGALLLAVSFTTASAVKADSFAFGIGGRGGFIGASISQSHGWHDNDDRYEDYYNDPNTAIRWHGRIDDTVTIYFQGTNVWQQLNHGNELRDGDYRIFAPLPNAPGNAYIANASGRGDITVVQQPRPWNHFTTAVRIYDPQPADGFYRFSLDFHQFQNWGNDNPQWNGNAQGYGNPPQGYGPPPPSSGDGGYQDRGYNH